MEEVETRLKRRVRATVRVGKRISVSTDKRPCVPFGDEQDDSTPFARYVLIYPDRTFSPEIKKHVFRNKS